MSIFAQNDNVRQGCMIFLMEHETHGKSEMHEKFLFIRLDSPVASSSFHNARGEEYSATARLDGSMRDFHSNKFQHILQHSLALDVDAKTSALGVDFC